MAVTALSLLVAVTAFVTTLQLLSLPVALFWSPPPVDCCHFLPPVAVATLLVLVGCCSQLIVAFR